MSSTKLPLLALALVTMTVALAMPAQAQLGPFAVDEPVPDLAFPDAHNGQPRALSEFRGERYILHVFASW